MRPHKNNFLARGLLRKCAYVSTFLGASKCKLFMAFLPWLPPSISRQHLQETNPIRIP